MDKVPAGFFNAIQWLRDNEWSSVLKTCGGAEAHRRIESDTQDAMRDLIEAISTGDLVCEDPADFEAAVKYEEEAAESWR